MEWFREQLHEVTQQGLRIERVIYEGKSEFQSMQVLENKRFGRFLVLDGVVQTTEGDEFFYHEMLSHVPLFALDKPKEVLIIGGGDGGCLEEVLKHPVERATMVELDQGVVDISREYLPGICGDAFDDPRTELIIGDGARFLAETDRRFDLIIIDSTDPIGPGAVLFSREFYANCRDRMTDQGILITQNGVPFIQRGEFDASRKSFEALFRYPDFYFVAVPTYALGNMALGCASNGTEARSIPLAELRRRFAAVAPSTKYYTPEIHLGAFARPAYLL